MGHYLSREQSVLEFSHANAPVLNIESGESVTFQTYDCFSDQIQSESDLVTSIDLSRVNPATGPVFVKDARPGDILKVKIEDVRVRSWGVISTLPNMGVLIHTAETKTKIVPVDDSKIAHFNERIEFDVNPMIGVIGVAPAGESVPCGHPGAHGGNIDTHTITKGATVYFPVNVEGALFGLGDVHASMGDGEICGTGIEIAGEVTATLSVLRGHTITRPVVETDEAWYTVAEDHNLETAIRIACEDMQRLLVARWDLSPTEAYLLMSVAGDVRMCQCCKPSPVEQVARFRMPKLRNLPRLLGE
ncbi:acetamidase/formamidase family protein [Alicyclobacillus ferrooxydans]|uniref:Acetamidase n=1 Tax=Alicyclobacillus ferrooxydans TaxID=471514 RepID=A0A0P9EWE1_9BACL|nr:acetamidase/formamidase family protein [Alicyclobacillus ferrooxydans]KPV43391.1 acetamidase [Alicyclobacillus ferrooxydans]